MVYLIIMVLLAGAGLARLWLTQRRQITHLATVEGFRSSLERLSGPQPADSSAAERHQDARRQPLQASRDAQVLDPERRAAAKRRLEERRRASRGGVRPS